MSARLIILVVFAAILAVAFAMRSSAPPPEPAEAGDTDQTFEASGGNTLEEIREMQKALSERALAGREPAEEPDFFIDVTVDPTGRKNRLFLDISEAHGYYVETFRFYIWYKPTPDTTLDETPLVIQDFKDVYLAANDTLRVCVDLVPPDMAKINGHMGTDVNWEAVVVRHGRARERDPDPLPILADVFDCD